MAAQIPAIMAVPAVLALKLCPQTFILVDGRLEPMTTEVVVAATTKVILYRGHRALKKIGFASIQDLT
jgi:hypothetical protein